MNEFPKLPPLDEILERARRRTQVPQPEPLRQPVYEPIPPAFLIPTPPPAVQETEPGFRIISTEGAISNYLRQLNPKLRFGEVTLEFHDTSNFFEWCTNFNYKYEVKGFPEIFAPVVRAITRGNTDIEVIVCAKDYLVGSYNRQFSQWLPEYAFKQIIGIDWDRRVERSFPQSIIDRIKSV